MPLHASEAIKAATPLATALIASILLVINLFLVFDCIIRVRKYTKTSGEVCANLRNPPLPSFMVKQRKVTEGYRSPVIKFYAQNKKYKIYSKSSHFPPIPIGKKYTIYFNPVNPKQNLILMDKVLAISITSALFVAFAIGTFIIHRYHTVA